MFQASSFPCVVIYVMDTSRSVNPVTFMSNMLYACRYVWPLSNNNTVLIRFVSGIDEQSDVMKNIIRSGRFSVSDTKRLFISLFVIFFHYLFVVAFKLFYVGHRCCYPFTSEV